MLGCLSTSSCDCCESVLMEDKPVSTLGTDMSLNCVACDMCDMYDECEGNGNRKSEAQQ